MDGYASILRKKARDNMQIVIDIPENLYKATINGLDANEIWDLRLAVKNGTPFNEVLNKLRAEIEAYRSDAFYPDDVMMNKRMVLEIIDKYRGEVDCRECKAEYECYECEKYEESEVDK